MNRLLFPDLAWRAPWVWGAALCAVLGAGAVLVFLGFLLTQSLPVFREYGWEFLFGREWLPGERYGALPMLYGSVMVTVTALLWVLPLAWGSALLTAEFLSRRARWWVKAAMELLAGVPGVLYGLIGVTVLSVWVRDRFGLLDGNTLFTASLLLAVMVLPTIMTLSEDALRAVPREYREAALGLGARRTEVALGVVMPAAAPALLGAVMLGLGRALGETIAVMLVIGGRDAIPRPWFNLFAPGQSIPSKLGREAAESLGYGMHGSALMALGLLLLLLVLGLSLLGHRLLRSRQS